MDRGGCRGNWVINAPMAVERVVLAVWVEFLSGNTMGTADVGMNASSSPPMQCSGGREH